MWMPTRVFVCGGSEGVHAAWDLIAMRPGFFSSALFASGWARRRDCDFGQGCSVLGLLRGG
jgi:predicted peptidase